MKGLGRRVGLVIEMRNLTANAVGEKLGMSRGHMSRIINGERENITADTLWKLAQLLNVNCEWLLTGEGPVERRPEQTPVPVTLTRPKRGPTGGAT